MKRCVLLFTVCGIVIANVGLSFGEEKGIKLEFTPSGFVSLREGQIVKASPYYAKPLLKTDHIWIQQLYTGFNLQTSFSPLPITGNIGLELKVGNEYPRYYPDFGKSRRLYFYPYLSRADLIFTFGDDDMPGLELDLGYFPFKYNTEARNLGEYLFRSGTYPQYIITEFDFPQSRLFGAHAGGYLFETLKWDILATTNIEWTALGDLNLSALVAYTPPTPFVTVGVGGGFFSLVSVDKDFTKPEVPSNAYLENGDTMYYSFSGAKVMGRVTFNPQAFFPSDFFGKEDLKCYSELAILGVKNYPLSIDTFTRYDEITERMPVMFGFNFPTFGIFDVLSIEFEYFKSRFPNDLSPVIFDNQPVPLSSLHNMKTGYDPANYVDDDWKWSVYGKKTFVNHFYITVQFARDHMRWYMMNFAEQDWQEALRDKKDWYYVLKLGYSF